MSPSNKTTLLMTFKYLKRSLTPLSQPWHTVSFSSSFYRLHHQIHCYYDDLNQLTLRSCRVFRLASKTNKLLQGPLECSSVQHLKSSCRTKHCARQARQIPCQLLRLPRLTDQESTAQVKGVTAHGLIWRERNYSQTPWSSAGFYYEG